MKKTIKSLLAIAITALAFTACSDVPEPYQIPGTGGGTGGGGEIPGATGTGQIDDPYNIAAAITKCKEIGTTESTEKYYVKGIVVTGGVADATFGNVSFDMADEAGSTSKFKAFQVLGSDAKKLPSGYEVKKGDVVIVYGPIYNYNGKTPETAGKGAAYIYSINGTKTDGSEITPPAAGEEPKGTGTQADPFNIAAAIKKCQEIGQTESTEKYYVKGVAAADASPDATYGNATIDLIDKEGSTDIFKAFQVLGSEGKKMPSTYKIAKGSTVIVYGPIYNYRGNTPETAGKGAAYIITVNGQPTEVEGGEGGGGEVTPGTPSGTGTQADPFNVAAAVAKCKEAGETATNEVYFVKGIVNADYTVDSYKNATVELVDAEGSTEKFTAYRVKGADGANLKEGYKIPKNAIVIVSGKLVNFKSNTPETAQNTGTLISVNGQAPELDGESGGGTQGGGGEAASSLTNGDFETWADGLPTGWKSASSASSATLTQSTDAHGGSYSVNVNGKEGSNVRLATQEIKLAAGTYNFSFWVKATTEDVSQARPGYVPIADGKAGTYAYGDYATLTTSWQKVSYDFTLDAETTVCLVVMNPKKSSYSSGKDILVDDATLTKK